MSSDSAKENASVVDSSLTERKQDIGNSDDPESLSYKANEYSDPTRADKKGYSHCQIGVPTGVDMGKLYNAKYFVIKSLNHQNIRLSIEKGIWATQIMNERVLEEAFHNSARVILIFSVKWLRLNHLPFHKTLHLKNPLNDYKLVKISRDCQELSQDVGEALCKLLNVDGLLSSSSRGSFSLKGHSTETPSSMEDENRNFPPLHLSWSMPLHYPSLMYQNQSEANKYHSANQRFSGTTFNETLPTTCGLSKVAGTKHSYFSGQIPKLQVDKGSQFDVWGLSAESPLASTLTEDDFLDMANERGETILLRSFRPLLPLSVPVIFMETCNPAITLLDIES
ncbi:hypothetical protein L6164_028161 [Bauhinia variegata]|uniref:Uncharacterized protein n=1 Tax=Bauhinia variegata TaxID=167791 RepID=A0ACB9LV47_BAUVA|nr:hypothetical protein L6164_028161 [Bauhinia variegata]